MLGAMARAKEKGATLGACLEAHSGREAVGEATPLPAKTNLQRDAHALAARPD